MKKTKPIKSNKKLKNMEEGTEVTGVIKVGNDTANEAGYVSGSPYKAYVALMSQVGTDAPTAIVLNGNDSNYLGDIVWTRNEVGDYRGTLAGVFRTNKTWMITGTAGGTRINIFTISENEINLQTINVFTDQFDENYLLENTALKIEVYQN